jgi:MFS transporter, DHA1 family, multidrug resistance protein
MSGRAGLSAGAVAVVITVVVANLGNNIVAPLMPAIQREFGSSAAAVALVASSFGLGRLLMDLPAGYLTERIPGSRLFAAGILLTAGAAALAAISTSLEQLILFRSLMGVGAAVMSTVALVVLVGITRPEQRGAVLGFYTSALLLGQALSPSIGGYLAMLFNWRAAFVFCALTPFLSLPLNLVASSRVGPGKAATRHGEVSPLGGHGSPPSSAAPPHTVNRPALGAVFFGTFVNFFSRQGMRQTLLPLYGGLMLGMDPGTIGAILTSGSVITIALNMPSGMLADRTGRKVLLIPGLTFLFLGCLLMVSDGSQLLFVAATVLVSMGVLANTMQSGLVADLVPESMIGKGVGLYRFTADLGVVMGPFVLGLLIDAYGFQTASLFAAITVLLGVMATLVLIPRRTLPETPAP